MLKPGDKGFKALDPRYQCAALQNARFVENYHKKWAISKHLISPLFKNSSHAFTDQSGELDSLSTLHYKDKEKVNKIISKHLPMLAKHAERRLASRNGDSLTYSQTFSSQNPI